MGCQPQMIAHRLGSIYIYTHAYVLIYKVVEYGIDNFGVKKKIPSSNRILKPKKITCTFFFVRVWTPDALNNGMFHVCAPPFRGLAFSS